MRTVLYTAVPSGSSVSGVLDLTEFSGLRFIGVPVITSGDLLLQGAFNTTSASFTRLRNGTIAGSADLRWATLGGSCGIALPTNLALPPYVRLETITAQADTRSFTLLAARW